MLRHVIARATSGFTMLIAIAACSTTPRIESFHDYNPNVNTAGYQTFAFMSERPMIVSEAAGTVNPLLEGRLMNAIRADLTGKGLRYVGDPEQADAVISFTVGSRDQIRVDQYPVTYRTGYNRYYGRYYGAGYGYGTETRVRQYTQGQLAIDVFDVATRTPAYHGTATTRITSTARENPEAFLTAVVTEALQDFPEGPHSDAGKPVLVPFQDP